MEKRKVQAIVLAGGFGTRLFPLTEAKPKPLVKIVNETVLDTVMQAILKTQADKITLSVCHFSHMIEKECEKYTKKVECIRETTPLGTAGGVKNCAKAGYDAYLVVSGDGVFDFDLQKVIDKHFENDACVSIVCTKKSNPTEYGTVISDDNGRIVEFNEKPAWKNVTTDLVNTGIYVLSKKALSMIPDNEMYDFSKQLFKKMLEDNQKLCAINCEGYWCDIGTLDEYKKCNTFAISYQNGIELFKDIRKEAKNGFEISHDSYVYKNAVIGKNASIKNKSIVCKNVGIAENCEICDSIVSQNSRIGKGSGIYGAIIGENVTVGENCIIPEGCVIGDNSTVKDSAVLKKGTLVKSGSTVCRDNGEKTGAWNMKNVFVDDGLCVFACENSFEQIAFAGMALALCFEKKDNRPARIFVGCDGSSQAYKSAFVTGALREGAQITQLEKCDMNILSFCSSFLPGDNFVYISSGENESIILNILEKNAEKLSDENERKFLKMYDKISGGIYSDSYARNGALYNTEFAKNVDVVPLYLSFVEEYLEETGIDAKIQKPRIGINMKLSQNTPSFDVFKAVLSRFGFEVYYGTENAVKITFSENPSECFVKFRNEAIDDNHIKALVLNNLEEINVKGIKIGKNTPSALQNIVQNKKEMSNNPRMFGLFENDSCIMLLSLLCVCTKSRKTLEQMLSELPQFEIFCDTLVADVDRAKTMHRLSSLYKVSDTYRGDGINLSLAKGNVTIIPSRAKGFKIISEAVNAENAKELCVDIEKIIKEKS